MSWEPSRRRTPPRWPASASSAATAECASRSRRGQPVGWAVKAKTRRTGMFRVLKFTGNYERDNRRYALMQQGMLQALPTKVEDRGLRSTDTIRREIAVLDALDGISEPDESIKDNPPGVEPRSLRRDVGELVLSQVEYDLL